MSKILKAKFKRELVETMVLEEIKPKHFETVYANDTNNHWPVKLPLKKGLYRYGNILGSPIILPSSNSYNSRSVNNYLKNAEYKYYGNLESSDGWIGFTQEENSNFNEDNINIDSTNATVSSNNSLFKHSLDKPDNYKIYVSTDGKSAFIMGSLLRNYVIDDIMNNQNQV